MNQSWSQETALDPILLFVCTYNSRFLFFSYTVPKEIDFPRYNMKCSGENFILRGIFHVVSCFPLHFMLYRENLDYFSASVWWKIIVLYNIYGRRYITIWITTISGKILPIPKDILIVARGYGWNMQWQFLKIIIDHVMYLLLDFQKNGIITEKWR